MRTVCGSITKSAKSIWKGRDCPLAGDGPAQPNLDGSGERHVHHTYK
jgi:hypothetical protein